MLYNDVDFINSVKKKVVLKFKKYISLKEIKSLEVITIELENKKRWGDVISYKGILRINNKVKIPYKLLIILKDEDDLGWGEIKSSKLELNFNNILLLKNENILDIHLTENEFESFLKKELSSSDEHQVFNLIEQFKKDAKVIGDKIKNKRYNGTSHEYDYIVDRLFINFKKEGVNRYIPSSNNKVRCYAGFKQGNNYVLVDYYYDKKDGGCNNELLIYYKFGDKKIKVTFSKDNGYNEESFYKLKDGYRERLNFLTKGK